MKIHCKYDALVDVKSLRPNPRNPNKHSPEQIERLAKVLKYQGVRRAVRVSNLSGLMTVGHGQLQAFEHNGWDKVPVDYQDYDDAEQEYADLVADNSLNSWSELDLASINAQIGDLGPDFDIDLLGLKDFVIEPADKYGDGDGEDEIPETPKVALTKMGDLFQLGTHRLLCGDSTVASQVARLMNGEKAAMWASDPPYGINHVEVANEKGQAKGYKAIANDELQDEALKEFILATIQTALPHMKKGFAFYMWHAMKMQAYFSQAAAAAAAAAGILFHRQIIWVKPQFVFGRGQYHWRHELCLMGWLQGDEPPFYGERNQSTVWEIGRENDKIHPTQKPVAIWEAPIQNHTKPGEVVYEPFSGSGSQLIACEKTNRKCYGMEIDPLYVDVILDRFAKFSGIDPVREDGVHWSTIKANGSTT